MRYHTGDGQLNAGSTVHGERCSDMEEKGCSDKKDAGYT